MKTQTLLRALLMLSICITVAIMLNAAYARRTASQLAYTADTSTTYQPLIVKKSTRLNNINIKARRNFLFRYKEANNETWYKVKGGFVAKFTLDAVANLITYKKNGEWLNTICSYGEKNMPGEIRTLVKSSFCGL